VQARQGVEECTDVIIAAAGVEARRINRL
jgi:hypothetical protein